MMTTLLLRRSFSTQPSTTTDFWSNLRWKAVQALTASLSESERQTLLVPHQPPQQQQTPSIAEAVAQTKLREAQKFQKEWDQRKEQLLEEAQRAAQARVEQELVLQQRQRALGVWQQQVAEEVTTTTIEHPILGAALVDLGYKRVHLVSVQQLAQMPVWEQQRAYRHDRVQHMAKDKQKTLELGLPGIIGLYEDEEGQLSILDGQHRVGMMNLLLQQDEKENQLDWTRILVEVYPVGAPNKARDLFLEVNKAEPVQLLDLPGMAKASDVKILNEAVARLADAYPAMFKASPRCRPPHWNVDNLRQALFASDWKTTTTPKKLFDWMLAENQRLKEVGRPEGVPDSVWNKAVEHDFYLGVDKSWLVAPRSSS